MFDDIEVKVIERKIRYRNIEGVRSNLKKKKYVIAISEAFKVLLNYYNMLKERWRPLWKICIDYEPPKEIGWHGSKYKEHIFNEWIKLKRNLDKLDNIYIHANAGIILDEDEQEQIDYSTIKFRREYYDFVDEMLGTSTNLVGVHIRRTDHAVAIQSSKTEDFIKRIDKILQENSLVKFFLATDDIREQQRFINLYGNRIIIQGDKEWGRNSEDGMRSAIIDVIGLSRCDYILGSHTSVFSFFAASYGKKDLIICKEIENV